MRRFDDDVPPELGAELEAEFALESAFEELTNPRSGAVDIENAFADLRGLRKVSPQQARRFLGLASHMTSHWVTEVGVEPVFEIVLQHLNVLKQAAETIRDEKLQAEFQATSTTLLTEALVADPNSYFEYLRSSIIYQSSMSLQAKI